ncbi:SoxR reducing system RseC family protein [Clostridium ganghwense]|uniref:SoxR reducing system RseC family protein n=1 Tax=Clostridium ganghwense TaxID=312089 RepID=A0ABT4CS39_9CLOT|nr:SoxR reducing system RseC family protein [Clostridium ganghwense]MCY6371884.1 SoxR reducing system RseC family protein [Clostridium ganghwense]
MTEEGYITSIQGDYASVIVKRKSGCGDNCASCKGGCTQPSVTTEVKNTLGASKGDKVKVSIEEKALNKLVFWAYVFPLIMMAIGIGGGTSFFKGAGYENYEMLSFLLGMVLLAVSYLILKIINEKKSQNKETTLKMVEIIRD